MKKNFSLKEKLLEQNIYYYSGSFIVCILVISFDEFFKTNLRSHSTKNLYFTISFAI